MKILITLGRLPFVLCALTFIAPFASADERWTQAQEILKRLNDYALTGHRAGGCVASSSFSGVMCQAELKKRQDAFRSGALKKLTQQEYIDAGMKMTLEAQPTLTAAQRKVIEDGFRRNYATCKSDSPDPYDIADYSCDLTLAQEQHMQDQNWYRKFRLVGGPSCNILRSTVAARADGCSAPLVGELIDPSLSVLDAQTQAYRSLFKDDCNLHDICYASPGKSKETCDKAFLDRMVATCGDPDAQSHLPEGLRHLAMISNYKQCTDAAHSWYAGLQLPTHKLSDLVGKDISSGQKSYNDGQSWARANCGN